jgi:aspartate carbamoyltransferase catalytic subunit
MRHPSPGSSLQITKFVDSIIVNAGDGSHEHPTQAMLDVMSLYEKFKTFKNLKVAIIGDIFHSRVALSNIYALTTLGVEVTLCGPPHLIPVGIEELGVSINYNIDEVLEWADAVNVLRIQRERMGIGLIPSIREYREIFGVTKERVQNLKKELVIMHPGPINRGVELDGDVADSENSIILDQVLNGVAMRMSILYHLLSEGDAIK